ncbi:MAG: hypothetical protein RL641_271 [Candidatus Parcubacteria bacterium]|jgi:hypothetical protein
MEYSGHQKKAINSAMHTVADFKTNSLQNGLSMEVYEGNIDIKKAIDCLLEKVPSALIIRTEIFDDHFWEILHKSDVVITSRKRDDEKSLMYLEIEADYLSTIKFKKLIKAHYATWQKNKLLHERKAKKSQKSLLSLYV